nr:hypothetical protein [Humisphaera borealis]
MANHVFEKRKLNSSLLPWPVRRPFPDNAHAVLASGFGQLGTDNLRTGSHQVGQADQLIATAGGFDSVRPANDEWDAVAAVPDIGLRSAPLFAGVMALFLQFADAGGAGASVIAGEDDQRVL